MNDYVKKAVSALLALSPEDLKHAKHLVASCDTVRKGVKSNLPENRKTLGELLRKTPVGNQRVATSSEVREILQQDLPGCRYSFSLTGRTNSAYRITAQE
jgi:glucose-6-phosphate isomerase